MIRAFYDRLNKREQVLVMVAVLVIIAAIFFYLIWTPIIGGHEQLRNELDSKQASLSNMIEVSDKIRLSQLKSKISDDNERTLASRISVVAKKNGIEGMRFSTKSQNELQFDMEKVSFLKFHRMLYELENQWGIQINSMTIRPRDKEQDSVKVSFMVRKQ